MNAPTPSPLRVDTAAAFRYARGWKEIPTMSRNMLGAAAALVLALATGCAILEGQEWTPDPASDAGIQAAASERLASDAMTADATLLVTVENGLATLTGNVPNEAVRQRAIQILEHTDGIFEVRDHTRIF